MQQNSRNTRGELRSGWHNVKDEQGYRAVFAEQRASASQIAPAKFLDTISKIPWYGWRNK